MYCSPQPSAHLKHLEAREARALSAPGGGVPGKPTGWTREFPKAAVHKLTAVLPDPRSPQSTLKKGFSEAAPSNSEIIPVRIMAGTGATLHTLVVTEGHGQGRKRPAVCSSVLSSKDKSGNEGRKPRMHREGGRMGVIVAFPGPGCTFGFGTLFLTKSQCSHHKHTHRH